MKGWESKKISGRGVGKEESPERESEKGSIGNKNAHIIKNFSFIKMDVCRTSPLRSPAVSFPSHKRSPSAPLQNGPSGGCGPVPAGGPVPGTGVLQLRVPGPRVPRSTAGHIRRSCGPVQVKYHQTFNVPRVEV